MHVRNQDVAKIHANASEIFSRYRRSSSTLVYAWYDVRIVQNRSAIVQGKSRESAKNNEWRQVPYDNCSLIKYENSKETILRSYQPIKKGKLYPRNNPAAGRIHNVSGLGLTNVNIRGTFLLTITESIRLQDHERF